MNGDLLAWLLQNLPNLVGFIILAVVLYRLYQQSQANYQALLDRHHQLIDKLWQTGIVSRADAQKLKMPAENGH